MTHHVLRAAICLLVMSGLIGASARAETQPPAEGTDLPAFSLPKPKDVEHQAYLGIAGKDTFKVSDIQAEVVLIEIFNMY